MVKGMGSKMIIKPKMRGFICTTAHPSGCAANVREWADYAVKHQIPNAPKRVLVIGSSTGYGLACRVASAFCYGADTIGVFFERESSGSRTATAGWYNNLEFERLAKEKGLVAESVNGDAFSNEVKSEAVGLIKSKIKDGKVDLVIYSLAAPKRTDPDTGKVYSSVIKPIGKAYESKTVDFHTGEVTNVSIEPATGDEIPGTVAVMGGDDWLRWLHTMQEADVLAENAMTVAFSYIGPSMTHAVYKDGTIGRAKEDLEEKAKQITELLSPIHGKAFVSVNKALVTQASSAIPVVPLYMAILFKLMKEDNTHEGCIEQMVRMYSERLYRNGAAAGWSNTPVDGDGRIRMDDLEMESGLQSRIGEVWNEVTTENVNELTDIAGYRDDFLRLFGFGIESVDYDADVEDY